MTARFLKFFALWAGCLVFQQTGFAQISISPNTDANALARILTGYGVQVFNAQFTGGKFAAGTFQNQNNNLGLDSGIVLTNGIAKSRLGDIGADGFAGQIANNDLGLAGDATLEGLINNAAETFDACVLEFDFIPAGDTVNFQFVFASDEYPEFNCTPFSDLFAFVLTGPGLTRGKNLALVPGTDIPVAINSINNGTPGVSGQLSLCQMLGPGSPFRNLYIDNSNSTITYNGMTVVLNAGSRVTPCVTYHLKLAIADLSDGLMDSGVFLQANSFNSIFARFEYGGNRDINNKPFLVEGCNNGSQLKILYSSKVSIPTAVRLTFTGSTADPEVDVNPPLWEFQTVPANDSIIILPLQAIQDNLPEGTEKLVIKVAPMICGNGFDTDSIEIDIREFWDMNIQPAAPIVCAGQSIQLNVPDPGLVNFNWTPRNYLDNFQISNPVATPADSITYFVTAEYNPGCYARDSVFVALKDSASLALSKEDIGCIANSGVIRINPGPQWVSPEFSLNGSPFTANTVFTNLAPGTYLIEVRDATGCIASRTITLEQLPVLQINAQVTGQAACNGLNGEVKITGSGGASPYQFSIDGINFSSANTFAIPAGNQFVYVRDALNCITRQAVFVPSDPPLDIQYSLQPDSCRDIPQGRITLQVTGGTGPYQFSIDGGNPQLSPDFRVRAGVYDAQVRDTRDCIGEVTINIPLVNDLFLNLRQDTTICEGESVRLTTQSNATRFQWTPAGSLQDPAVQSPWATPTGFTRYTVEASSGLCVSTGSVTISVSRAPVTQVGPDIQICEFGEAELQGSGSGILRWQPASLFSDPTQPVQRVRPTVTTTYWLEARNEFGCVTRRPDSITVFILPPVNADAGRDTTAAIGQPLQLSGNGQGTVYEWTPPMNLSDPQIENPVATITQDITYYLRVTNAAGCWDTASVFIKAYKGPDFYVPSAFTPNNDGLNDVLRVIPAGIREFREFRIYNRWGEMIYFTRNPRDGWDGRVNGQTVSTGTFVWIAQGIDYRGNPLLRKGTVTLIR